jgi:penicillin-binding protein 1A
LAGQLLRSYLGDVTVEYAVQRSINTIPVKLVELLTPRVVFDFLKDKLHITTLVESGTNNDVAVAPMALGSLTEGVSPLEVVGAYQ